MKTKRYQPNTVLLNGSLIFVANDAKRQANRLSAQVQPGQDDDGKRISVAECEAFAKKLAAADALLTACKAMVHAYDLEDQASPFNDQITAHRLAAEAIAAATAAR